MPRAVITYKILRQRHGEIYSEKIYGLTIHTLQTVMDRISAPQVVLKKSTSPNIQKKPGKSEKNAVFFRAEKEIYPVWRKGYIIDNRSQCCYNINAEQLRCLVVSVIYAHRGNEHT